MVVMNLSGEFLKKRREELNLRQKDVADRAGISVSYLSTLERGQRHSITNAQLTPDRSKVVALAKALKTDRDELLVMFGFAPEGPVSPHPPQTLGELKAILENLGIDAQFFQEHLYEEASPEELQDVLDAVQLAVRITLERKHKKNNDPPPEGLSDRSG